VVAVTVATTGRNTVTGWPRKRVTVEVDQTVLRILPLAGTVLTVVARTNTEKVNRHKAYGGDAARTAEPWRQ
jgi:hypothetical protein